MPFGTSSYSSTNEAMSTAYKACATDFVNGDETECNWTEIAMGDTCLGAPLHGVINGPIQADPTTDEVDLNVPLGVCVDPNLCEGSPGMVYWRTIHGPFWQETDSTIPIEGSGYKGSNLRIMADANGYAVMHAFKSAGSPAMAASSTQAGQWKTHRSHPACQTL